MVGPTLTVAICAYTTERWEDLRAAVDSVHAQQHQVDETLVVIDHHGPLLAMARRELAGVSVIANSGPRGLSGARNTALAHATGDVIAFLDDDAAAETDWSTHLLGPYQDLDVLGVGGFAQPAWDAGAPRWFPEEFLWVVGCSHRGLPTTQGTVRNLIGCNMSMRTNVLRAAGGFDTGLGRTADRPLGCEETEACIRAQALYPNGRFLYEPAARVHHRVPASRGRARYFVSRCWAEGISKAWVSARVGTGAATSVERQYTLRTLPAGMWRGAGDAMRGDMTGAARTFAIVGGFATTAAGFAFSRAKNAAANGTTNHASEVAGGSLGTFVVDCADELPTLERGLTHDGRAHEGAHCLVLDGGRPIGTVELAFHGDTIEPSELADKIAHDLSWSASATRVEGDHLGPSSLAATVVIATRNRPEQLVACLESILSGSVPPRQLIVVDNAPNDDRTRDAVTAMARRTGSVMYVRENRPGLAVAHNAALPHVTSPIVAFTDDDVLVGHEWLERIIGGFTTTDVACVTGMIVPLELDTLPQRWIESGTGFNKGYSTRSFHRDEPTDDPLFPFSAGAFGSGANMAFRTSYLREVGGFDEALGAGTEALGGDDLAAFFDVVNAGHRLVYEPAAFVRHRHHRDLDALTRQAYGYGCGLTAYLTRCIVNDPRVVLRFVRLAARGLGRARSIAAPPPPTDLPPYPRVLARQQWSGMLAGPVRYLRSRRALRAHRDQQPVRAVAQGEVAA